MTGMVLHRGRGFSLLELMLVLALAMLVTGWALPSLDDFLQGVRVNTTVKHYLGMLESTRYRSMSEHRKTTICATAADGVTCNRDGGTGLVIFEDRDEDGVVDATEKVVLQEMLVDGGGYWLAWRSFQSRPYLRWALGRTDSMNGTYTLCNREKKDKLLRQLVVNRTGRTRIVVPARSAASVLQSARQACGW